MIAESTRCAIFSLRPEFARLILCGRKTVELRRVQPNLSAGQWGVVYSSTPERAVIGCFRVRSVDCRPVEEIWERWGMRACLSREDFMLYFQKVARGTAIIIDETQTFQVPIPLERLRSIIPGFVVPQSYRFLSGNELSAVNSELVRSEVGSSSSLYPRADMILNCAGLVQWGMRSVRSVVAAPSLT